jgi:glycogen operon protein
MVCGGDEIGRTQKGNNNSYCQDNEISWYDWKLDERKTKLLEFTRRLIEFRRAHPNLRRRKFYQDREVYHSSLKDIAWYQPDGQEMIQEQWNTGWMRSLALLFNGNTLNETDELGEPVVDDSFLILMNSSAQGVSFTLPLSPLNRGWKLAMNTHDLEQPFRDIPMDEALDVAGRSVVLLRELAAEESKRANAGATEVPEPAQAAPDGPPAEPVLALAEPEPEESKKPKHAHAASDESAAEAMLVLAESLPED